MKRLIGPAVAAALAFTIPALAQTAAPAPKHKPEAQKAEKKPAASAHKSRRNEDARACLERGTNTEIIKCAEAYL